MTRLTSATDPTFGAPAPAEGTVPGLACCLSGGGYRAMLFHVGSLWRLNEAGLLPSLKCVSSVSGGSITSAALAVAWDALSFGADSVAKEFINRVVTPLRELAGHTIDVEAVLIGGANPFGSIAGSVAAAYRKYLFGHKTLQDLPTTPIFVIDATNVQTSALWRFTREYMGDYRVGRASHPKIELAIAVGASSAFPPFLSPVHIDVSDQQFQPDAISDLNYPPYTTQVFLSDGGVYDNLGLEPVFKHYDTVLVSDGGQKIAPEPKPEKNWAQHSYRVLDLIDNQVRSLRKRILIAAYIDRARKGTYWGIGTNILDYQLDDAMNAACPHERTLQLAAVPTRLQAMTADLQERLINWGYAVCDAALRKHCNEDNKIAPPSGFPYPERGV